MAHLDATYGGSDANSYIDVAYANEYFLNHRLYTDEWDGTRSEQKEQSLMWATKLLDAHVDWHGTRKESEENGQPLRWPRFGIYGPDGHWFDAEADMPIQVKDAVAEMAMSLLTEDRTAPQDSAGIKRLKVDVIELEFDANDRDSSASGGVIPEAVAKLIDPIYGTVRPRKVTEARLVRT